MASAFTQAGRGPAGGITETTTDALPIPSGPVQVMPNWVVFVRAAEDSLPTVALAPDQPPEAVQEVAFVDDQVSVDNPPLVTEAGVAVRDTVGGGDEIVTAADALCVPPNPVHERLNVLLLVSAPEDSLPEIALEPDQLPDAVQAVAFVENQVRVEEPPLVNVVGFAESDTVGTGGGGGEPDTVIATDAVALPPDPAQVME